MSDVDLKSAQGATVGKVDLPDDLFGIEPNVAVMHQVVTAQLAAARAGTHSTLTRAEVAGGGAKPWRQKGTGRARQGSTRAAQWVGGGKVHTPMPRDYSLQMPRKMRRAALRSALSSKAAAESIVVLDELRMEMPKTQAMAAVLRGLVGEHSALILLQEGDENVEKSVRNLPQAKTLRAGYLNLRDLLSFERLVMPLGALETIRAHLGTAGG